MLVRRAFVPESLLRVDRGEWPYTVPCVAELARRGVAFERPITMFVGENGSGKSTLVEAIAEAYGLDARVALRGGSTATTDRRRRSARSSGWNRRPRARGSAAVHGCGGRGSSSARRPRSA